MNVTDIWDIEKNGKDDRAAPIFFAAIPGTEAEALKEKQTLFFEALETCLNGACGEVVKEDENENVIWGIDVYTLSEALDVQIKELNEKYECEQMFTPGYGYFRNILINYLKEPPAVSISLEIDPEDALQYASVQVKNYQNSVIWDLKAPINPHPFAGTLPAGNYIVRAKVENQHAIPYTGFEKPYTIKPPRGTWKARLK